MATTFVTFPSSLDPTIPTFVGNGSKIEVPDLQVVFWGPSWPGNGQLSVGGVMQAVNSIVTGPYLEGMKQYGYTGPVNVRQPIVNTGNPNINYPPPSPNLDQSTTTLQAVRNLVDAMVQNNTMGDVTSNHDLLVMVFLDPTLVFPQTFDANGNSSGTVFGAHSKYEKSRFLAPAIRFSFGWVGCKPARGMSAFDAATWTFSHELVEAISNPFDGSGWVQTAPASPGGQGEIGDICNKVACVVDSICVQPYWGVGQAACILPTEQRRVFLTQQVTKQVPSDSPTLQATVNMGPLCGGTQTFDYTERTWDNAIAITAQHPGYEVPTFTWSINGKVMPAGNSTVELPATWHTPPGSIDFTTIFNLPIGDILKEAGGVLHPNSGPKVTTEFHATGVLADAMSAAKIPITGVIDIDKLGGVAKGFDHKPTATVRVTVFSSVMIVECGPAQGNCFFTVGCQVEENWDGLAGTTVTTQKANTLDIAMENQEIIWGTAFQQAAKNCADRMHKAAGGITNPGRPINPGDPGPGGVLGTIEQVGGLAGPVTTVREIDNKPE